MNRGDDRMPGFRADPSYGIPGGLDQFLIDVINGCQYKRHDMLFNGTHKPRAISASA